MYIFTKFKEFLINIIMFKINPKLIKYSGLFGSCVGLYVYKYKIYDLIGTDILNKLSRIIT